MTKAERVRRFSEFLRGEGYSPRIDDDGDIVFKFEGGVYLILLDEKDEEFFRLVFPNFWSLEDPEERQRAERAALKATADTKAAKVFPVRDNTWATIEFFCSSVDEAKTVFTRSLRALRAAVGTFAEAMRG